MHWILCASVLLPGTAWPEGDVTWYLDLNRSRLHTDAIALDSAEFPSIDQVPAFNDNPSVAELGARFEIGAIPIRAGVFVTGSENDFVNGYDLGPNLPALVTVRHTLRAKGARVAWSPVYRLSDRWVADGSIGLQYVERRIGIGQLGDPVHQSETGFLAGIGATWWMTPEFGLRAGFDYTGALRTAGIGVRLTF